jgi:hypothetical protein
MEGPMYYLAQKYRGIEEQAFLDAKRWTYILQFIKKVSVFSPIMYSHVLCQHIIDLDLIRPIKNIDWLKYDLDYCQRWLNSGLVMLFAPTCFVLPDTCQNDETELACHTDGCYHCRKYWASKGAHQEYDWGKANKVRCLLLDEFIAGKEVEI